MEVGANLYHHTLSGLGMFIIHCKLLRYHINDLVAGRDISLLLVFINQNSEFLLRDLAVRYAGAQYRHGF